MKMAKALVLSPLMVAAALAQIEYDIFAAPPPSDVEAGDILFSKLGFYEVKDEEAPIAFTESTADHLSHLLFGSSSSSTTTT